MVEFDPNAILHGDFETRSVVDLRKFGLHVYANHPSTDVWCFAYAFDDEPVQLWVPGRSLPMRLAEHIRRGGRFIAHNVIFEWYIWNYIMRPRYNWPVLKFSQLDCTMARAYAMALPGSLKNLSWALGVGIGKDMGGHALMMKMAKPRKIEDDGNIIWWDDAEKRQRLGRYCIIDVEVERECDKRLVPLSDVERNVWLLDLRINARGIAVDNPAIVATQRLVGRTMKRMNASMKSATNGHITEVSQAKRLLAWCKTQGVEIESLKKKDMTDWLDEPDLPFEVREVLEIRSKSAKVSVAKLETMQNMSLIDGRLHGMFQYHAASTGRFAGRGVQVHNLPRPEEAWENHELQNKIITEITNGKMDDEYIEEWYGPFMRVISSCVRGFLIAGPGKELIGADLKNIEGVMLAWLAGEQWKLTAFADNFWHGGPGIYELTAGRILGKKASDITKAERQMYGKVPELALGYGGGKAAFKTMAVNLGMDEIPDDKAEGIKNDFREVHPATKNYWYAVERAAIQAVKNPGGKYFAGPKGREICFRVVGEFLWLKLPSGRCLCYPFPQLSDVETPWGEMKKAVTFMTTDSRVGSKTKGKFVRLSSYGGRFVENITQAAARDILTEAMPRIEAANYPIMLHVHDELVSEVKKGFGDIEEYETLMSISPPWAAGLPIAADGFRGKRYRK